MALYHATHFCHFPALYSSTVYTYAFQRRVSDGSFLVASETKSTLMPGVFALNKGAIDVDAIDVRVEELVQEILEQTKEFAPKETKDQEVLK